MFIRAELKEKAKQSIHRNLWIVIGTCLVASLLTSSFFGVNMNIDTGEYIFRMGLGTSVNLSLDFIKISIPAAFAIIVSLLSMAYTILVANPLQVGHARFYIENREEPSNFEVLFSMFKSGIYFNVVKVMLLRDIYIALWTLLLIIPGIYKSYQYLMIPYILAEKPTMDSTDAFEMTKLLTQDVKMNLFILQLSFILWYLFGVLTCGIALFYAIPYQEATMCEAYIFLRNRAIEDGYLSPVDDESEVEIEYVEPTIEDLH